MPDDTAAFVIPIHPVPRKKDNTGAARAKAYRQRKRQEFKAATTTEAEPPSEGLMPPDSVSAAGVIAEPSEVPPAVTPHERSETDFTWNMGMKRADLLTVAPSRLYLAPVLLTTAALALSAVGIAINGWFARSLGSSDLAGWLFLAVGVAADLAALVLPSTAAGLWHTGQRATALVGWVVWFVTFVFAVTGGLVSLPPTSAT